MLNSQLYPPRSSPATSLDRPHPLCDPRHLSRFKWVSAARSQPHPEVSPLLAAITDTEQVVACMHADVLALLYRLEVREKGRGDGLATGGLPFSQSVFSLQCST